jgi:hypothetical protein
MSRFHETVDVGGGARLWTTWEGDGTPIVLGYGGAALYYRRYQQFHDPDDHQ